MPEQDTTHWSPGTAVLIRHGRFGQARWTLCATVIDDRDRGLAVWVPPRSPASRGVLPDGRDLRAVPVADRPVGAGRERPSALGHWRGPGAVMVFPTGAAWAAWWLFDDAGALRAIKGDLQEPVVRWRYRGLRGLDGADHALDVMMDPDGRITERDADDLVAKTGRDGYWDAAGAERIRATGRRLAARMRSGDWPFDGRFDRFRPDPAWLTPSRLPEGWDHPHRIDSWRRGGIA